MSTVNMGPLDIILLMKYILLRGADFKSLRIFKKIILLNAWDLMGWRYRYWKQTRSFCPRTRLTDQSVQLCFQRQSFGKLQFKAPYVRSSWQEDCTRNQTWLTGFPDWSDWLGNLFVGALSVDDVALSLDCSDVPLPKILLSLGVASCDFSFSLLLLPNWNRTLWCHAPDESSSNAFTTIACACSRSYKYMFAQPATTRAGRE